VKRTARDAPALAPQPDEELAVWALLDFVCGDSVERVAQRLKLEPAAVEGLLRTALAAYGFSART
jgi:hypothetical protein